MVEETFLSSVRPGNGEFTHLAQQIKQEKNLTGDVYEKVTEGLLASAGTENGTQGDNNSTACRLVGRDHFLYRIPATHARVEGTSQRSCRMCAEKSKRQTGKTVKKCTTMYCRKCDVGLCVGQCFEVYHSKLNYWE